VKGVGWEVEQGGRCAQAAQAVAAAAAAVAGHAGERVGVGETLQCLLRVAEAWL